MAKPSRYLVFKYDDYYPSGGWDDLAGSFDTNEPAIEHGLAPNRYDFMSSNVVIVDIETGDQLELSKSRDGGGILDDEHQIKPDLSQYPDLKGRYEERCAQQVEADRKHDEFIQKHYRR
jgi:hypothetical protein